MKSQKIISTNPGDNYKIIGEIALSTHAEIDAKVKQSRDAQKSWGMLDLKKRIEHLEKIYQAFDKRKNRRIDR